MLMTDVGDWCCVDDKFEILLTDFYIKKVAKIEKSDQNINSATNILKLSAS